MLREGGRMREEGEGEVEGVKHEDYPQVLGASCPRGLCL